jgi:hypothetical protein
MVTLWNCVLEVLDSNFGCDIGYPEVSRTFLQPIQANSGIIYTLSHNSSLKILSTTERYTVEDNDNIAK